MSISIKCPTPVNPCVSVGISGVPSFEDMLVYKFATSIDKFADELTNKPGPMVTTYTAALQHAYWDLDEKPDIRLIEQYYKPLKEQFPNLHIDKYNNVLWKQATLHAVVDTACEQQHWSDKDKNALHEYVKVFMHELQEPQRNIGTEICREMLLSPTYLDAAAIKGVFRCNSLDVLQYQKANAFLTATAKKLTALLPNNLDFLSAGAIATSVSGSMSYNLSEQCARQSRAVTLKYPIESAVVRELLSYKNNIPVSKDSQAFAFYNSLSSIAHKIMQENNFQFDCMVTAHRDEQVALHDFIGPYCEKYLREFATPEDVDYYFKENALTEWKGAFTGIDSHGREFTQEEIMMGFLPLSSAMMWTVHDYVIKRAPTDVYETLGTLQEFVQAVTALCEDTPWDIAGAEKTALGLEMLDEETEYQDVLFARYSPEKSEKFTAEAVVEKALNIMHSRLSSISINESDYQEFEEAIRERTKEAVAGSWTFASLATMSSDKLEKCYARHYQIREWWEFLVNRALHNTFDFGGYDIRYDTAYTIATNSNVVRGLCLDDRAKFCEALDEAATQTSNLSEIFKYACETLDPDVASTIRDRIEKYSASLEAMEYEIGDD